MASSALDALYFLDARGNVIMSRTYREDIGYVDTKDLSFAFFFFHCSPPIFVRVTSFVLLLHCNCASFRLSSTVSKFSSLDRNMVLLEWRKKRELPQDTDGKKEILTHSFSFGMSFLCSLPFCNHSKYRNQLSRDMAEVFKKSILENPQSEGTAPVKNLG